MSIFYKITTNYPEIAQTSEDWRTNVMPSMKCMGCKSISLQWRPRPFNIVLKSYPHNIVGCFVNFTSTKIFHVDFINQITSYLPSYHIFGKCFLPSGQLIEDYVTCYSTKPLLIRGAKGTNYGECEVCGCISGPPRRPRYILRSYLTGSRIYQDGLTTFYIDEDLAMEIDFSQWPDAELEPIEVREIPIDNRRLSCDPPNPPWDYLY